MESEQSPPKTDASENKKHLVIPCLTRNPVVMPILDSGSSLCSAGMTGNANCR